MAFNERYSDHDYECTEDSKHEVTSTWPEYMDSSKQRLFIIERSKNANLVVYYLNFEDDGSLNEKEPVRVQWESFGWTDQPTSNGISWLEKKAAYGFSSVKVGDDEYELTLVALPQRKATLKRTAQGEYAVYLTIDSKEVILRKLYVSTTQGFVGLPKVHYVDLFGHIDGSAELCRERITP